MYYDEQVIGGVLCHRSTPKGEWIPFTSEELTEKYTELLTEYAIRVDRAWGEKCYCIDSIG